MIVVPYIVAQTEGRNQMILHLGSDYIVPLCEVIAIIDADTVVKSKDTREFIKGKMKDCTCNCGGHEETKSYIIAKKDGELCLFASAISSHTLLRRTNLSNVIKSW